MKLGRNAKEKIELIKDEAQELEIKLDNLLARLTEHPGTKRMASKLEKVKDKLEDWRRAA